MRPVHVPAYLAAIFVMAAWCAAATDDAHQAVRRAIVQFAQALDTADAAALRQLIWVLEDLDHHRIARDAFVDLIVAQKKLERAAAGRFGAEGARFRSQFDVVLSPRDLQSINKARVSIEEGRLARVYRAAENWPMRLRREDNGQWQVVLDLIDIDVDTFGGSEPRPDSLSSLRNRRMRNLADATQAVADRVERGETATASAAEADLADRIAAIDAQYLRDQDSIFERWRRFSR